MTSNTGNQLSQGYYSAKVWKDLKDETGFGTYEEYLKTLKQTNLTSHEYLFDYLQAGRVNAARAGYYDHGFCSIWDISNSGTMSGSFSGPLKGSAAKVTDTVTDLLTVLRDPSSQAMLRVIVLEPALEDPSGAQLSAKLPPALLDAIGLGLRIVPEVFEAYLERTSEGRIMWQGARLEARYYGSIGDAVITVVRDYLPGTSTCPPVLLVMHPSTRYLNYVSLSNSLFAPWADPVLTELFEPLFNGCMKQYEGSSLTFDVVFLHTLLPLLKLSLRQLKHANGLAKDDYLREFTKRPMNVPHSLRPSIYNPEEKIEATRFALRRQIRHYEQCMREFRTYLRENTTTPPESTKQSCLSTKKLKNVSMKLVVSKPRYMIGFSFVLVILLYKNPRNPSN